jgi:hypothetical protein
MRTITLSIEKLTRGVTHRGGELIPSRVTLNIPATGTATVAIVNASATAHAGAHVEAHHRSRITALPDSDVRIYPGAAVNRRDGAHVTLAPESRMPIRGGAFRDSPMQQVARGRSPYTRERLRFNHQKITMERTGHMRDASETEARAEALARRAHAGQVDKLGVDYIHHPEAVAGIVRANHPGDVTAVVVAWLHDVVEDTEVGLAEIRAEFGDAVADAVGAITRRDGEDPDAYYDRVAANATTLKVKRADLTNNADPARTALLSPNVRERLAAKYQHAIARIGWGDDAPSWADQQL